MIMLDLDRYIMELARVQKEVHLYAELFCDPQAISVLNKLSSSVFLYDSIFNESRNCFIYCPAIRLNDRR